MCPFGLVTIIKLYRDTTLVKNIFLGRIHNVPFWIGDNNQAV